LQIKNGNFFGKNSVYGRKASSTIRLYWMQVRKAKRHVISEYEGTGVKLSCPGAKVEQLLLWKNGTLDLNPYLVATETAARITYLNHLVLHIKNLTKYDCQVYRSFHRLSINCLNVFGFETTVFSLLQLLAKQHIAGRSPNQSGESQGGATRHASCTFVFGRGHPLRSSHLSRSYDSAAPTTSGRQNERLQRTP
jgi:hypothetical protein